MTIRSCYFILCTGLFLASIVGCADAKQDRGEIPATIGEVQDAKQDGEKPRVAPRDLKAKQQSEPAVGLESARKKQDLVTLMRQEKEEFAKQTIDIPSTWKRMWKESHIWADPKTKQVIVRGRVCVQDGLLEMFGCPVDTKEHESVVSVHGKASEVHATLLAMSINPGQPVVWGEKYFPAHGPIMNIEVWWTDESGKLIKRRAQDMIRNTETGKAMACDFVFGGSDQRHDDYQNRDIYYGDDGPMINVANQPDAMIDVSIESSEAAQGSLFEAFTENVPPVNTKVYILISASGKMADAVDGKPTIEELQKAADIRRAEMEKRFEEMDRAREARKAAEKKAAEAEKAKADK